MTQQPSMVELEGIQGTILRDRPLPFVGVYVLLRIDDSVDGRLQLSRLAPRLASGLDWLHQTDTACFKVAFIFAGFKALDVPEASLASFASGVSSGHGRALANGDAFTRPDRFVMELFRTISPNGVSVSALPAQRQAFGEGYSGSNTIVTPHPETSRDPVHWTDPDEFNPDRYKQAATSEQNDEARCKQVGLGQCPFNREEVQVKDGRNASIPNSPFGAVYARIDDHVYSLCDDAGYDPHGFGYRRCAGEFMNIGLFKDLLRKVWRDKITFAHLDLKHAEMLPVAPRTAVADDIGFTRG